MAIVAACGTAAPRIVSQQPLPDGVPRTLFVISATHKTAAIDSLRRAGLETVGDLATAGYVVRVTVGVDKASGDCGTLNNVKFALGTTTQQILELKGQGWTGSCRPNLFDEMSNRLAERFREKSLAPSTTKERAS